MSHAAKLVAEIANELDLWPGVQIERRSDGATLVRYKDLELLDRRYREARGEEYPDSTEDPA